MAKGEQVDNQVAAPAEPRTPNLHRAKRSLLESANGSMATAAAIGQANNLVEQNEKRIDLTPAGLLMEGVITSLRPLFAGSQIHGSMSDMAIFIANQRARVGS